MFGFSREKWTVVSRFNGKSRIAWAEPGTKRDAIEGARKRNAENKYYDSNYFAMPLSEAINECGNTDDRFIMD